MLVSAVGDGFAGARQILARTGRSVAGREQQDGREADCRQEVEFAHRNLLAREVGLRSWNTSEIKRIRQRIC